MFKVITGLRGIEIEKFPFAGQFFEIKEGAKTRKESTTSMRVFDLEKNEWRSFTLKKVKQVNISIP